MPAIFCWRPLIEIETSRWLLSWLYNMKLCSSESDLAECTKTGPTFLVTVCTHEMVHWSDGLRTTCQQTCLKIGSDFARWVYLYDVYNLVYSPDTCSRKPAPEIGAIGVNLTPNYGAIFSCCSSTSDVIDCEIRVWWNPGWVIISWPLAAYGVYLHENFCIKAWECCSRCNQNYSVDISLNVNTLLQYLLTIFCWFIRWERDILPVGDKASSFVRRSALVARCDNYGEAPQGC